VFLNFEVERDGGADELEGLPLGARRLGERRDGDLGSGVPDLVAGQGGQALRQATGARSAVIHPWASGCWGSVWQLV